MSTVRATHKKFLYKHKIHLLDLYKKSGIISASNKFGKDYIMKAKRIISAITAAVLLCAAVFTAASCQKSSAKYTVGICQLVKHDALDAATKGFTDELKKQFGDEIEFIEQNAQGQTETCTSIINTFVTRKVDLILANATSPLQAAAGGTKSIPVLGTSVTEYGTALGISDFSGTVGGNVSGTSDLAPLDQQAAMVKELFPDAKTVGLLYCSAEPNSEYQVKVMTAELAKLGYACEKFSFSDSNDVTAVSKAAAAASDVLYVPTDNTAASCAGTILGAIGDKPLIAGEKGICSGCGVATLSIDYYDLGVATGKMAAKILRGEADISKMPIEYAPDFTKLYNADRCKALEIDTAALDAAGYKPIS